MKASNTLAVRTIFVLQEPGKLPRIGYPPVGGEQQALASWLESNAGGRITVVEMTGTDIGCQVATDGLAYLEREVISTCT